MTGLEPDETRARMSVPDAATSMTSVTLLRGGLWSTASRIIPQVYILAVSVAAARFLGPEAFGRQSFIAFVELSLILLLTGGLSAALLRFVGASLGGGHAGAVRRLATWAWLVEGLAAAVGAAVLVGAALAGAEPESAWVLAGAACAVGVLHAVPSSLLIGAQLWREASIVGLVTGAFSTVAVILVLAAGGGITGMFAVEAVVSTVNLVWTTLLARRRLATVASPGAGEMAAERWRELRGEVWRYALPASYGIVLTLVVWRRSEFLFLESFSTETEIALYSVAFAAVAALIQLPEAIAVVMFPAVATLFGAGAEERIRRGFARALRLLLLVTLPLTAVAFALGPTLLRVVWGEDFADSGPVLLILLMPLPLIPLLYASRSLLAGVGRLRVPLLVDTAAAVVKIALAFALVPSYGALGAAVAHVAALAASAVAIYVSAARTIGGVAWRPVSLLRAAAASAAAGGAAWACVSALGGVGGLVVGAAAAAVVFAACAVGLRILPDDDADWLVTAAGHRLGGAVEHALRRCSRAAA